MSDAYSDSPEHVGLLSASVVDDQSLRLTLLPFVICVEEVAKPVFEITVEGSSISKEELAHYDGYEAYIYLGSDNRLLIADSYNSELEIEGTALNTQWRQYSRSELLGALAAQIEALNEVRSREFRLSRHVGHLQDEIQEMKRRAEIKASASAEQKRLQDPVLTALDRLMTYLEGERVK